MLALGAEIVEREAQIDFTNKAVTKYLIKLSALVDGADERVIGSYFHVLNDLERIGDHAENFYDIGCQMQKEGIEFSDEAKAELISRHYARLAEGNCKIELSPYFSSAVSGLERVADHLVNIGYSILNPTGSQSEARKK